VLACSVNSLDKNICSFGLHGILSIQTSTLSTMQLISYLSAHTSFYQLGKICEKCNNTFMARLTNFLSWCRKSPRRTWLQVVSAGEASRFTATCLKPTVDSYKWRCFTAYHTSFQKWFVDLETTGCQWRCQATCSVMCALLLFKVLVYDSSSCCFLSLCMWWLMAWCMNQKEDGMFTTSKLLQLLNTVLKFCSCQRYSLSS